VNQDVLEVRGGAWLAQEPRLPGRVAVVAGGGSRGQADLASVGEAISVVFAKQGAQVIVATSIETQQIEPA
jgi:NAD(P)-dependent dehydrogenase (short-subunit alcohol dehydrogenase family)